MYRKATVCSPWVVLAKGLQGVLLFGEFLAAGHCDHMTGYKTEWPCTSFELREAWLRSTGVIEAGSRKQGLVDHGGPNQHPYGCFRVCSSGVMVLGSRAAWAS